MRGRKDVDQWHGQCSLTLCSLPGAESSVMGMETMNTYRAVWLVV